jgi:hypothetical protein
MSIDPRAELEATRSLAALLEAAERCREVYERAHMALPEPLKRLYGIGVPLSAEAKAKPSLTIPPPEFARPPESQSGWISVPMRGGSPATASLAVLRAADGEPVRARDIQERVQGLLRDSNPGSVANVGTKLDAEGVIERGQEGWRLLVPEKAPVIHEGRFWGPPTIFGKYELAAVRREAILHLLRLSNAGLQTSQIIDQLSQCSWLLDVPVNKEIVQADVEFLQEQKTIRRRGASKKWEIAPEKGDE